MSCEASARTLLVLHVHQGLVQCGEHTQEGHGNPRPEGEGLYKRLPARTWRFLTEPTMKIESLAMGAIGN